MGLFARLALFTLPLLAQQDPRALILESAGRYAEDQERERNYTYRERVQDRRFDGGGKVKSTESKVYEVISLYGRPYHRLVEKDGKRLPANEDASEQRKIDKELEKRSQESERSRNNRLAKEAREFDQERAFRREFAEAFLFKLLPEDSVSGLPCYVVQADPKPGYRPRSRQGNVLTKVKGKLWISKLDKRWVKVEAETIDTFSMGWFLLRVARGTRLSFEAERVGGEMWMPSHAYIRGEARVAAVKKLNLELDVRWSDFHKFSTDSRIVDTPTR